MDINKFLNAISIKPIPLEHKEEKPPHHYLFFSEPYPNIGIISKKKSGKTTVIFNIIKKAIHKGETKFIIFCSTIDKDKNYQAIRKFIEDNECELMTFTSIKDEEGNNKLSELMSEMGEEEEKEEEEPEVIRPARLGFIFGTNNEEEQKKKQKRESKYTYPEYVIIFDDLSDELKNPFVSKLLKTNRHYKAMVICSTQYICDLKPESLKQMDYLLLFKSFDRAKLDKIYTLADINLGNHGKDGFAKLYEHATNKPYSFLYISSRDNTFRRNFFPQYNLTGFFSHYKDILNENANSKTKNNKNSETTPSPQNDG